MTLFNIHDSRTIVLRRCTAVQSSIYIFLEHAREQVLPIAIFANVALKPRASMRAISFAEMNFRVLRPWAEKEKRWEGERGL